MDVLAFLILYTLHAVSFVCSVLSAFVRLCFPRHPQPLDAPRRQLPANLGLAFVPSSKDQPTEEEEESMLQSVKRTVRLCRTVGIHSLSVYDRHGQYFFALLLHIVINVLKLVYRYIKDIRRKTKMRAHGRALQQ